MPLQNRVNPLGELVANPSRGTLTGNRGIIHNLLQQIERPFQLKAWITCTLTYKNFRRQVMTGRKWTELFFLDEATALAAGHRPCAFCRNADYKRFKQSWLSAHDKQALHVKEIDAMMHADRIDRQKRKVFFMTVFDQLPDGAMFRMADDPGPLLVFNSRVARWSFDGYASAECPSPRTTVEVITPACTVRCLAQGYMPSVHESFFNCF